MGRLEGANVNKMFYSAVHHQPKRYMMAAKKRITRKAKTKTVKNNAPKLTKAPKRKPRKTAKK